MQMNSSPLGDNFVNDFRTLLHAYFLIFFTRFLFIISFGFSDDHKVVKSQITGDSNLV